MTVRPNKNSQHEDTPMATPLLLQAEHVAKAYAGIPALRDGRLSLRAGSVHALCGGNGAGKSTFLSILKIGRASCRERVS